MTARRYRFVCPDGYLSVPVKSLATARRQRDRVTTCAHPHDVVEEVWSEDGWRSKRVPEQPREHPVPCQRCGRDTWAHSAVCDDCGG